MRDVWCVRCGVHVCVRCVMGEVRVVWYVCGVCMMCGVCRVCVLCVVCV